MTIEQLKNHQLFVPLTPLPRCRIDLSCFVSPTSPFKDELLLLVLVLPPIPLPPLCPPSSMAWTSSLPSLLPRPSVPDPAPENTPGVTSPPVMISASATASSPIDCAVRAPPMAGPGHRSQANPQSIGSKMLPAHAPTAASADTNITRSPLCAAYGVPTEWVSPNKANSPALEQRSGPSHAAAEGPYCQTNGNIII